MSALRLFISSLLLTSSLFAQELFFERVKLQMFGNIGLTSIGIGGDFSDTLRWDLFYGFVPENYGGIPISTIAGKLSKDIYRSEDWSLYGGSSLAYALHQRYEEAMRDKYPESDYYETTSIHLLPFIGSEFKSTVLDKSLTLYFEIGTVDVYAVNWYKNRESIEFEEIINFAFGVGYDF